MSTAIVFSYGDMGTAAFAALAEAGAQVLALVLPSNRVGPDVEIARAAARAAGLPVRMQPPRDRIDPFVRELESLAPDVIVIWSYSMILPGAVIGVPRRGCVNVHGGLLPSYRGPHVMQWAIINGETETGVTLHYVDTGIDTGPVIAEERLAIAPEDDAPALREKLRHSGSRLLRRWWPAIAAGTAPRVPQDESRAKYYPLRTPEDGRINWSAPAVSIHNLVRALAAPWPGAFTQLGRERLVLRRAVVTRSDGVPAAPGVVSLVDGRGARVGTGSGELLIVEAEVGGRAAGPGDLASLGVAPGLQLGP
jgi:methionyl-tRNA formyltransferase